MAPTRDTDSDFTMDMDSSSAVYESLLLLFDYDEYAFSAAEVADKIEVDRKTALRVLNRLVADGWVEEVDEGEYYHITDDEEVLETIAEAVSDGELGHQRSKRAPVYVSPE